MVTSNTNTLPWLDPASKFSFMSVKKIASQIIHMPYPDVSLYLVLNIIFAIKFGYLPLIQFALEKLSLGYLSKLTIPTATTTDMVLTTAEYLTAASKKTQKSYLATILYHHTQSTFWDRLNILQCLSFTKTTTISQFSTSKDANSKTCCCNSKGLSINYTRFFNISPTTRKHHRDMCSSKRASTKPSPLPSAFSIFNSKPWRSPCFLDYTDPNFATLNLPAKLQYLFQQEIKRASDSSINTLLKINAVLYYTMEKFLNK